MLGQKQGESGHIMVETTKHLCCVRCRECELVTNPCDVCNGMTEQERASAMVARSRRMSRHRRRRTQRSGSGGSGTSVADSVSSRRGSTPVLSTSGGVGKGGAECSSLTRVEGSADRQGSRTRSPAGDLSGLDVRSSGTQGGRLCHAAAT